MPFGLRIKSAEIPYLHLASESCSLWIARVYAEDKALKCRYYLLFSRVYRGRNKIQEVQSALGGLFLRCLQMEKGKKWQGNSLYFKANDDKLDFNNRNLNANDNYSGGLVVLGKSLHFKKSPRSTAGTLCLSMRF